jgi:carboxymethylenebutenolidase
MSREPDKYLRRLNSSQDYLIREFVDNYEDGAMSRRDMIERVFRITGSVAVTAGLLWELGIKPAYADPLASVTLQAPAETAPMSPFTVAANDPALITADITFPAADGATLMAYVARPRAEGRYPVVLVCHENQGTSEHFRDVTRRFAKNGYVALHLDLLGRFGGTNALPANERGAALSGPGRVTWNVAIKDPSLRAAAPYYGRSAFIEETGSVRAAVLGVYAANDMGINSSIDTVREQLSAARRTYRINIYPDAGHAFFNDTRPTVYVESAATAAWRDTLAWFNTYLRAGGFPGTGDGDAVEEQPVEVAEE